ncbi:MAG TPA: hypothetical protein VFV67_12040 [Actinophytocola sp.]|uniref:hypothetical protein n=1 Tax=Actinophytocola sp. TaxID=1872138 RepID=UPI002DBEB13A|nr:hypothetical protein [Actinophytocola sp.]HEU5471376.1 hypothetical protein [Actinophytocola sp.]
MANESEPTRDTLQAVTESAAEHLGKIATIVQTAVVEIAKELGEWFSDVMEVRESSAKATEATEEAEPSGRPQP